MRKLLVMIGAAVVCLALGAYADGTTLTWNGAAGASWEGANWLNGETPSAWVDGANAIFPEAATVALSGGVVVSNITASGTLTLKGVMSDSSSAPSSAYLQYNVPKLVFPGMTLDEIDGRALACTLNGSYIAGAPFEMRAFHYVRDGNKATAQFQCVQSGSGVKKHFRAVKVEFTEKSDGVYASSPVNGSYLKAGTATTEGLAVGTDIDEQSAGVTTADLNGTRIVAQNFRILPNLLTIEGEASFGGAVTVSDAAIEVVAPIAQTWNQAITSPNGALSVKGPSSREIREISDSTLLNATTKYATFNNTMLSSMRPVSAYLRGSYIGAGVNSYSLPYNITYSGADRKMTCQFQFWATGSKDSNTGIKCVVTEFSQDGVDVKAHAVQGYFWSVANGASKEQLGADIPNASGVATYAVAQYAVESMVLKTASVPAPYLTLGAANALKNMIADNADIVFTTKTARPTGLIARNSASVLLVDYGHYSDSGSGKKYTFKSGSILSALCNLASETRVEYVFDDSTLCVPTLIAQQDGLNYFNYITLRNGAKAIGNPLRCGSGHDSVYGTWIYASDGLGTNRLDAGVCLVNTEADGQRNTLVITTATDMVVSGRICDFFRRAGTRLAKRGDAPLTLESDGNTWSGGIDVEAGTLALAPGVSVGTGDVAVDADATLAVSSSGVVDLSVNALTLNDGATLAFNFTDRETAPTLSLNAASTLPSTINVKVTTSVANMKLKASRRYLLATGCNLTGKTVNVIDKPEWVASVVVNGDGNLELIPKAKGLIISFF